MQTRDLVVVLIFILGLVIFYGAYAHDAKMQTRDFIVIAMLIVMLGLAVFHHGPYSYNPCGHIITMLQHGSTECAR